MKVIRPVMRKDLAVLNRMAESTYGINSLPNDIDVLRAKIELSLFSFSIAPPRPNGELYLFVLEDTRSDEVLGCCALLSKTGGYLPNIAYRLTSESLCCKSTQEKRVVPALEVERICNGPAELCTLYLFPQWRQSGLGKLLSLSRFLFLNLNKERFDKRIQANLRGFHDNEGRSPFFEQVMRPFFQHNLNEILKRRARDPQLFNEFIPHSKLYVPLLPNAVQEIIGVTHPNTTPARRMLERQGMTFQNRVDLFDAGPYLAADVESLSALSQCRCGPCVEFKENSSFDGRPKNLALISNHELATFRAVIAPLVVIEDETVYLKAEIMQALMVKPGDPVSYLQIGQVTDGQ